MVVEGFVTANTPAGSVHAVQGLPICDRLSFEWALCLHRECFEMKLFELPGDLLFCIFDFSGTAACSHGHLPFYFGKGAAPIPKILLLRGGRVSHEGGWGGMGWEEGL